MQEEIERMDQTLHRNRVAITRTVVVYQSKQLLLSDRAHNFNLPIFTSMLDVFQFSLSPRTVAVCQSKLSHRTRLFLCFMNSGSMPVQVIPIHAPECWLPPSGFPPLSHLKGVFPGTTVSLYLNTIT